MRTDQELCDLFGITPDDLAETRARAEAERIAAEAAAAAVAATDAARTTNRSSLTEARELLLAYGTPQGLSFVETYSAVQTAVLDYRDAGVRDEACEQHLQWITTRVGEITASALYSLGALL